MFFVESVLSLKITSDVVQKLMFPTHILATPDKPKPLNFLLKPTVPCFTISANLFILAR